jgi:TolA-binding protein
MVTLKRLAWILVGITCTFSASAEKQTLSQEKIDQSYSLSFEYEKAQSYQKSIEALNPVYEAYPNSYTINYRLGWLYYCNGNFADAIRLYRKALAIYPASIEVMICVSLVYKAQLDFKRMEEENLKILKIDYCNLTATYNYVLALKALKKLDIAEGVCRKMLAIYPTSQTFLFELGETLYFEGKMSESLATFISLRTLYPNLRGVQDYIELLSKK